MANPKSLIEAIQYFSDEQVCIDTVAAMRWPEGPVCPDCLAKDPYYLKTQKRWKCRDCRRQFSVKVESIFEDSPISLTKWLPALWLLSNCKNGVSSHELARDLKVTQKTAWFMLHRLRLALKRESLHKMGGSGGPIEVDETFIGGNIRNMHRDRKRRYVSHGGSVGKTVVMGMLERDARQVRAKVISDIRRETLQTEILREIEQKSTVYTDRGTGYDSLAAQDFIH